MMEAIGGILIEDEMSGDFEISDVLPNQKKLRSKGDIEKISNRISQENNISCGYACCALGWASLNKTFQRDGLFSVIDPDGEMSVLLKDKKTGRDIKEIFSLSEAFFGINSAEVQHLFFPDTYDCEYSNKYTFNGDWASDITPDDVIRHIDNVISGRFRNYTPTKKSVY